LYIYICDTDITIQ